MEFENFIVQASWKVMEMMCLSWKVMEKKFSVRNKFSSCFVCE